MQKNTSGIRARAAIYLSPVLSVRSLNVGFLLSQLFPILFNFIKYQSLSLSLSPSFCLIICLSLKVLLTNGYIQSLVILNKKSVQLDQNSTIGQTSNTNIEIMKGLLNQRKFLISNRDYLKSLTPELIIKKIVKIHFQPFLSCRMQEERTIFMIIMI